MHSSSEIRAALEEYALERRLPTHYLAEIPTRIPENADLACILAGDSSSIAGLQALPGETKEYVLGLLTLYYRLGRAGVTSSLSRASTEFRDPAPEEAALLFMLYQEQAK